MAKSQIPAGLERVPAGQSMVKLSASQLRGLAGERFEGLNVLKLNPDEGVDGVVITKIGTQTVKGRGKEKGKTREIPKYTGEIAGVNYGLPLNRSFVDKAVEAKLAVGDTIAIICEGGYTSKDGNKGVGYSIIVRERAKKK